VEIDMKTPVDYYAIVERALLRWLHDGETVTIDKLERRQREVWLILKTLMDDRVVEIVSQNERYVTFGLVLA
jgi:hypothetical protein